MSGGYRYFADDDMIRSVTKGDNANHTFLKIPTNDPLYSLALDYVKENIDLTFENSWSITARLKRTNNFQNAFDNVILPGMRRAIQENENVDEAAIAKALKTKKKEYADIYAGEGIYRINFQEKNEIYAVYRAEGPPVAGFNGVSTPMMLVLFVKGKNRTQPLTDFVNHLGSKGQSGATPQNIVAIWRYNADYMGWESNFHTRSRPEGSVILPTETKQRLLNDVNDFVDKETKFWYYEKGIPYKRSYLFYGVPGSGKTSIITVLAGIYKRPICYISPTHPKFTDDALKSAIQNAPLNGIIVLEDIDGLFKKNRSSNMANHLTFSGLLNALDGIGSGLGQIFIMTTNYRDRLDSALIRNGRVDLQVEFKHVNDEQVEEMFNLFYPKAADEDKESPVKFRELVFKLSRELTDEPCVSAAMLQNFFITHRKLGFKEAIEHVPDLISEIKEARDELKKRKEEEEKEKKKAEDKKVEDEKKQKDSANAEENGDLEVAMFRGLTME